MTGGRAGYHPRHGRAGRPDPVPLVVGRDDSTERCDVGWAVPEPGTRPAEIVAYADGPFLVRGAFEVVGQDGTKLTERRAVALCGCGRSRLAPFCDGTHKRRRSRPRRSAPRRSTGRPKSSATRAATRRSTAG
ncbi:MAG: CDGSH iron-sulfur domain-containing protein [Actinomycetota bacterium]